MQDVPIRVQIYINLLEFIKNKEYIGSYNTEQKKETKNSYISIARFIPKLFRAASYKSWSHLHFVWAFSPILIKPCIKLARLDGNTSRMHAKSQIA